MMKKEIEFKFLVDKDKLPSLANCVKAQITQAYISFEPVIRVGIVETYFSDIVCSSFGLFTIKSKGNITRTEFEKVLPSEEAKEVLSNFAKSSTITKTRYYLPYYSSKEKIVLTVDKFPAWREKSKLYWEIDFFQTFDLIMAELEVPNEHFLVKKPNWITQDVSKDERYFNVSLSKIGMPKPTV